MLVVWVYQSVKCCTLLCSGTLHAPRPLPHLCLCIVTCVCSQYESMCSEYDDIEMYHIYVSKKLNLICSGQHCSVCVCVCVYKRECVCVDLLCISVMWSGPKQIWIKFVWMKMTLTLCHPLTSWHHHQSHDMSHDLLIWGFLLDMFLFLALSLIHPS